LFQGRELQVELFQIGIIMEAGRMRLEYGPKGQKSVEVKQGDFFHIPPRLVHRDANLGEKEELLVVNILVGKGEPVINVKSPRN
jgi:uncharacterized RmlC-like cupin family protein